MVEKGTFRVKGGLADMLRGGVILEIATLRPGTKDA